MQKQQFQTFFSTQTFFESFPEQKLLSKQNYGVTKQDGLQGF